MPDGLDSLGVTDWATPPLPNLGAHDWQTAAPPPPAPPPPAPAPVSSTLGGMVKAGWQVPTDVAGGLTQGVGSMVAAAGTAVQGAATNADTFERSQVGIINRIDAGETVPAMDDPLGYGDASPEQRATMKQQFLGNVAALPAPQDSDIGQVGGAIKSAGQGVIGAGAAVTQAGEDWTPMTDEEKARVSVQAVKLGGGLLTYLGAGLVGGPAAVVGVAGVQGFGDGYKAAKDAGASDEDAATSGLLRGMVDGGLMTVPIHTAIDVAAKLPNALKGEFVQTLWDMAKSGVTMTTFSQLQTVADNVSAGLTYNPDQNPLQGAGDPKAMALQFAAGAALPGAGAAMNLAGRLAAKVIPTRPIPNVTLRTTEPVAPDQGVLAAPDVDSAINAAQAATKAPPPAAAPTDAAFDAPAGEAPADTPSPQPSPAWGGSVEASPSGGYQFRQTDASGAETVHPVEEWHPGEPAEAGATTISPETATAISDHYAAAGVDTVFYKADPALPFDGSVDPAHPNTLFLSNDPSRNIAQVAGHEFTHVLTTTTLPDGTSLGDLLNQQVAAGITPAGQRYAANTFGATAPTRDGFASGATGDADHAAAVQAHLVAELGTDIGGEAPKFQSFLPRVVNAIQARFGNGVASDVLGKLIDGLSSAMDTIRGLFGETGTRSQNWVTNIGEIHDTLAQMYAARFGTPVEREQAALGAQRDQAERDRFTAVTPAEPPTAAPEATPSAEVSQGSTPGIPATKPFAGTGLGDVGMMGSAIADNMHAMLWAKLQAGDMTEGGAPSNLMMLANRTRNAGGLQTPAEFRAFANTIAPLLPDRTPGWQGRLADAAKPFERPTLEAGATPAALPTTEAINPSTTPEPGAGSNTGMSRTSSPSWEETRDSLQGQTLKLRRWLDQLAEQRATDAAANPRARLLTQTEAAILRPVGGDETALPEASKTRLEEVRTQIDQVAHPVEDTPAMAAVRSELATTSTALTEATPPESRPPQISGPHGDFGDYSMFTPGARLVSESGRALSPVPTFADPGGSNRAFAAARKKIDAWLIKEAQAEAAAKGDAHLVRLLAGEDAKNFPPASRATALEVVFGSDRGPEGKHGAVAEPANALAAKPDTVPVKTAKAQWAERKPGDTIGEAGQVLVQKGIATRKEANEIAERESGKAMQSPVPGDETFAVIRGSDAQMAARADGARGAGAAAYRDGLGNVATGFGRQTAAEQAAFAEGHAAEAARDMPQAPADPAQGEDWWKNKLTESGRQMALEAAGLKTPPTTAWQYLKVSERARLLAANRPLPEAGPKPFSAEPPPESTPQGETQGARPDSTVPPEPPPRPADYGANNSTFTADAADRARARLREKLGRLNAGFDPEMMLDGLTLAGFHIEAGARTFADYAKAMLGDIGNGVRPFLAHFYNSVREYPGFDNHGMDGRDKVAADLQQMAGESKDTQEARDGVGPGTGDLDQRGDRGAPEEGRGAGQPLGDGPTGVVEAQQAGDDAAAGQPGAEAGLRPGGEGLPVDAAIPEGGLAADGRPGAGDQGMVPDGAGGPSVPVPAAVRPNFHIDDPDGLIGGTPKVRFARNRAAVEALAAIEEEQRAPTPAELQSLAGYIGWGSFGQDLFQGTFERQALRPGWDNEGKWLRDHLGKEAWESAQRSIINAHYTDPPTVKTMWDMVQRMGFKGGRVLEPSMGIGNFFGMMPRDVMANSTLTGIELDRLSAQMAKLLYPEAGVHQKGYQDSKTPDGFYDLVIGNWPFAAQSPADRRYDRLSPTLHDYFFLKALDQTRPGGLVVGITSAGTMDKAGRSARIEMAKKGELLGAFRLPLGAFEKYAGTSVVTDILVFRKRTEPAANVLDEPWINASDMRVSGGNTIRVNDYFQAHPDAVLGTLDLGRSTIGRQGMTVHRPADFEAQLASLPSRLPTDGFSPAVRGSEPRFVSNNSTDRQNSVTIGDDGKLYQVAGERMTLLHDISPTLRAGNQKAQKVTIAQVGSLVGMRRTYGDLIDAERDGRPETEDVRQSLAQQYQAFVAAHGPLTESRGLAVLAKAKDPAYAALSALVRTDGTPSQILSEPTIRSRRSISNPSVADAYVLARNETATLDMDRVAELASKPRQAVEHELLTSGAVMRTPGNGFEPKDVYLSGNVRRKLREAQEAQGQGEDMQSSIDALTNVLPPTVPYYQIEAKFGAPWAGDATYKAFIGEVMGLNGDALDDVHVRFAGSRWRVTFADRNLNYTPEALQAGHPDYRFDKLVQAAMGNNVIKISKKDGKGDTYVDPVATEEVNAKTQALRERFQDWAWADAERKVRLETAYNETMNAIAKPHYDGSFMDLSGMALRRGSDPFSLRNHQMNAIWRGVVTGRGLFAHEVGTGKSYTMGGIAVEGRRYGVFRKPLVFAHNANSAAVAQEFQDMYPGGKFLYIDNLAPDVIETTLHRIANEDWDAVVMPHSLIDRMTLTKGTLTELAADSITDLENEAIEAAREDGINLTPGMMDDAEAMKKVRSVTAKQLVKQREAIIANIEKQANRSSREGAVAFETLGIDAIIVDEAHCFPHDAMVLTDQGPLKIGDIVAGRLPVKIASYDHAADRIQWRPIANYWRHERGNKRFVTITTDKGALVCTENHQVFIAGRGYVDAASIQPGEELRSVRTGLHVHEPRAGEERQATLLQQSLRRDMAQRATGRGGAVQRQLGGDTRRRLAWAEVPGVFGADDSQQSHEQTTRGGEDARQPVRSHVSRAGRQWATDEAAVAFAPDHRAADGARNLRGVSARPVRELAELLQGGLGGPSADAGNRGGWSHPRAEEVEVPGPAQDGGVGFARVVGVEVHERGSVGEPGAGSEDDRWVYDLGIEGEHNYFANGLLVHNSFKKPPIATRMQLKGLNTATSARSIALDFLTGYTNKQNNGRGTYLFTGTPVTNALNEVYNMARYFMRDRMEQDGVKDWDAWFNTFADGVSDVELTAGGGYEPVKRLSAFVNVDELVRSMSEFTDVVQAKDMPEFVPRETADGKTMTSPDLSPAGRTFLQDGRTEKPVGRPYKKILTDVAEMSPEQRDILTDLQARWRAFKDAKGKEKQDLIKEGEGLKVGNGLRAATLDARMYDPEAPDDPTSKVNRVAANVLKHYQEDRAGQAIFVDQGYNAAKTSEGRAERFVLVQDLVAKLVEGGIPRREIKIIAGGISAEKKKEFADGMNSGRYRVGIGQSSTLGVGVNMQTNLRAMHHMDAPWRPGDLEQRNGRGERQGNEWNTVLEYRYVTEGIDGRGWQILTTKDRFIKQFISAFNDDSGKRLGNIEGDAADISEDEDILQTLGQAAGDPRIMLRAKYQADVTRLGRRERMHTLGQADAAQKARSLRQAMASQKVREAREAGYLQTWDAGSAKADVAAKAAGDTHRWYDATVAGQALHTGPEIQTAIDNQVEALKPGDDKVIATINGHDVVARWRDRGLHPSYLLGGNVGEGNAMSFAQLDSPTIPRITASVTALRNRVTAASKPGNFEESVLRLEAAADQGFPRQADMLKKRQQLANLVDDLQANPVPPPAWLRHGAPLDSVIYVDGQPRTVRGHRETDDYKLLTDEGDVSYRRARDENGNQIYEVHAPPVQPEAAPDAADETDEAAGPGQFSPKITGAQRERAPYTPEQEQAFRNVGRITEEPTWRERLQGATKDLGRRFIQAVVDPYIGIKADDPTGYMALRNANTTSGALLRFMTDGTLKFDGSTYAMADRNGGVENNLIRPLQGEENRFIWWVAANRAERLSAEDRENLWSQDDIDAIKGTNQGQVGFDYKLPNGTITRSREAIYLDSLRKLDAFNRNTLDLATQSGLISTEAAGVFLANPFYVPFYRQAEGDTHFSGASVSSGFVKQYAFKALKGGTDKLNHDLWQNAIGNWSHMIDASLRNKASSGVLDVGVTNGAVVERTQREVDHMMSKAEKQQLVWVMTNGQKQYFQVTDPMLYTAVSALDFTGYRNPVMNAMTKFKTLYTMGVTADPRFMLRIAIKDAEQAVAVAPALSFNLAGNIIRGFKMGDLGGALRNVGRTIAAQPAQPLRLSDEAANAMAGGATMHLGSGHDTGQRKVDLSTMLDNPGNIGKFWNYVATVSRAIKVVGAQGEDVQRLAIYHQLIADGVPHDQAAFAGRDLEDFTLRGAAPIIRAITQTVPFLNATLQGLYKVGRAAADQDRNVGVAIGRRIAASTARRVAVVMAATTLLTLALDAIYGDDEDYKKRSDQDRNTYFWFKLGSTQYRIPMGFEIAAMSRIAANGVEAVFGASEMSGRRFMNNVGSILANNLYMSPVPQAVSPLVGLYANKNEQGGKIVSDTMSKMQSQEQYTPASTMLARGLSAAGSAATRAVGGPGAQFLAPVQIDYLANAYLGWLGTMVTTVADVAVRTADQAQAAARGVRSMEPVRPNMDLWKYATGGMITTEPTAQSRYVDMMYQQADGINHAFATYHDMIARGQPSDARAYLADNRSQIAKHGLITSVTKTEAGLETDIKRVEASPTLSAQQKHDQIAKFAALRNKVAEQVFGERH